MFDIYGQIDKKLHDEYRSGKTLKELSDKYGLSLGHIGRLLSGKRKIKNMELGTVLKLFPNLTLSDNKFEMNDRFMTMLQDFWPELTEREKGEICGLAADFVKVKKKHIPQVI